MEEEQNQTETYKIPGWAASAGLLIAVITLLVFLYITMFRYSLVGKAIDMGDTTSSALLLTPEIATGISTLLRL
jgi:hypothetical protein